LTIEWASFRCRQGYGGQGKRKVEIKATAGLRIVVFDREIRQKREQGDKFPRHGRFSAPRRFRGKKGVVGWSLLSGEVSPPKNAVEIFKPGVIGVVYQ